VAERRRANTVNGREGDRLPGESAAGAQGARERLCR